MGLALPAVGCLKRKIPVDGPLAWLFPSRSGDFSILRESALDFLWLCQDSAGNLAQTLGGQALVKVGASAALYQQAVTNYFRKAVGAAADGDSVGFRLAAGVGPNPAAGSAAWAAVMSFPTLPANNRQVLAVGATAPQCIIQLTPGGQLRINVNGVTTAGAYNYVDGLTHWVVLVYNKTTAVAEFLTDQERVVGTYDAGVVDATKGLGGTGGGVTAAYRALWCGAAAGASAERDWRQFLINMHVAVPY